MHDPNPGATDDCSPSTIIGRKFEYQTRTKILPSFRTWPTIIITRGKHFCETRNYSERARIIRLSGYYLGPCNNIGQSRQALIYPWHFTIWIPASSNSGSITVFTRKILVPYGVDQILRASISDFSVIGAPLNNEKSHLKRGATCEVIEGYTLQKTNNGRQYHSWS